ncbi:type I restriction endonuclease subunit R [Cryobacterium sp. TMT1-2-1]|uniref:type I restriction endonuclease subunit R n=1 Tax=Cryobacterium sp. TMT1-2-1 TaxID=1259232 RepID=UPI0010699B12|nr:type I restriction endonuclease subunit R [Cryobacterium sp. TMT1-2-1]TFD42590.1 type I restriction endonuclease subunit R [Cryobacterium sp. TMT1-2-1]
MSDSLARKYNPIAVSAESTVVTEYVADPASATSYQSEADLEREMVRLLQGQAYEYLPIKNESGLIANLRAKLEALNNVTFTDREWDRFFATKVAGQNDGIIEKSVRVQEDHVQTLMRDDGSTKNITLIDKKDIHNNQLQVINQYGVEQGESGGRYANRYDVTVLVNGLPMVHIELKRRGVDIREAFNQIDRYQRDSFWAGSGLFDYVQLFVISNGTLTKYYSNSTRSKHIKEASSKQVKGKKSSNSFEFTSWWTDAQNNPIQELTAFTKTFFAKHSLLNTLTRYCVLTVDRDLLVMRPYQIVATERILQKIEISTNYRKLGTIDAGGYVWHTTGSGKTLTSFKTAQLASKLPDVAKVLFVVDRKDLDYQTMREYDRFEKGAANSNASTAVLKKQLEDPNARIIITTIQKLSTFVKSSSRHEIYSGHVVIIFDECHRSQFGDMHTDITRAFKRYNLFGFTGTPIFSKNASSGGNPQLKTTEQAFGEKLHTYTIVDAITDQNVLPFRIDYVNTVQVGAVVDKDVSGIQAEMALLDERRLSNIVQYILEHFDQKTKRNVGGYEHSIVANVAESVRSRRAVEAVREKKRLRGFNALFATASIDAAQRYYLTFKRLQGSLTPDQRLKIGVIFSYGANEATNDGILDDEAFDTDALSVSNRDFLESAIRDYNEMFDTSYDTSADKFQNYYKDLSQRMKNREIDLVIVVNMFLTGFDATTMNTLFVDKNLRSHGLVQAYSRTNRILNSVKTYGNIVTFRNLEDETNAALELFGNKDARGVVLLKPYCDYYSEYSEKVNALLQTFPLGWPIVGEAAQKEFITLFGSILRLQNILTSFDDFVGQDALTERLHQDYRSIYLDLYAEFRKERDGDKEKINDDVVFEIELVKQVEINVDYILILVEKYRAEFGNGEDKEIRARIARAVDASPSLRSKRDLVESFVDSVSVDGTADVQWRAFVEKKREAELESIIGEHKLKPLETHSFIDAAFRDGQLRTTGTDITKVLPPVSRFNLEAGHNQKKKYVIQALTTFFERFLGLAPGVDE